MIWLRRLGQAAGTAALTAVGALLVLEATDVIGGTWRDELASAITDVASPTWSLWVTTLVGVVLAVFGMALVAAQLLPTGEGLSTAYEVHVGDDGTTRIRGRAAVSAVRHELAAIEGVVDVHAGVGRRRIDVDVEVDDRVNLETVETEARRRLGHGFWIDLGLADFTVNLLVTHRRKPPRVR